jgi:hypothetical protein
MHIYSVYTNHTTRIEQRIICGLCHKSTTVPSSNFANGLRAETFLMKRSMKELGLTLSRSEYIKCENCRAVTQLSKLRESKTNECSTCGFDLKSQFDEASFNNNNADGNNSHPPFSSLAPSLDQHGEPEPPVLPRQAASSDEKQSIESTYEI